MLLKVLLLGTLFLSIGSATMARAQARETHSPRVSTVEVLLKNLVHFENGITLMLAAPINGESCFHIENLASFPENSLKKINDALTSGSPLKLKVSKGAVIEVY